MKKVNRTLCCIFAGAGAAVASSNATAAQPEDLNDQVLKTVSWLSKNKAGLGYDLKSRFTEDLSYGTYVVRSKGAPKTMCVAAVFEIIVRTLAKVNGPDGQPVSTKLLDGKTLDGSRALNIEPYVFQYKALKEFPDYKRRFSAGAGDAFVLFGIGGYVDFDQAKAGDFVYLNREKGGGHATVFISYLGSDGRPSSNASAAAGFRYFSAQEGGTHGFGYRDAFFGACPNVQTEYKQDCKIIKTNDRGLFNVSRLYEPSSWAVNLSAIRIEEFFKGTSIDEIVANEPALRARSKSDLDAAAKEAAEYAKKGVFPLIVPKIDAEIETSRHNLNDLSFSQEFGPDFSE